MDVSSSSSDEPSEVEHHLLQRETINPVIAEDLCRCHCNRNWSYNFVEYTRRAIVLGTRRDYLCLLKSKMEILFPQGSHTSPIRINGEEVCLTAWKALYGVTNYTFYLVLNSINTGTELSEIHGNALRDYAAPKTELIHSWLTNYISTYGDKMPNSDDVYLPIACEKLSLWELMLSELEPLHSKEFLPEPNTFFQVWQKDFPHLKIPQCVVLGKCDVCCDLNAKIATAKGREKIQLQHQKKKHLQVQSEVNSFCNIQYSF
jgi:hypothetical protein